MKAEKGATYLDKLCHKFYGEPKGHGEKTDYVCRLCGGPLETYYCEERLYLVRCVDCGTLALVKTTSPQAAAGVTLARPTLTPPNEPLTQADLDKMHFDRVWIDYGVSDDGEREGEDGVVLYGKLYSIDTLDGSAFEDLLLDATGHGDTLDNPSGNYTVYRRPPEGKPANKKSSLQEDLTEENL